MADPDKPAASVANEKTADEPSAATGAGQVYEVLRRQILRGELPPNEPLSQVKLAERLGVSRTPLREALPRLEADGLIESAPRRRIQVTPFEVGDLEDVYAMRIVLEVLGVHLTVPRLSDEAVAKLEDNLDAMDAEEHNFERWEIFHVAFHQGLVAGGSERLRKTVADLSDHAVRYRRLYLSTPRAWTQGATEHRAILDGARERDAERAAVELARHYARTAFTVIAQLAPEHEPTQVRLALRSITGAGAEGRA